MKLMHFKDYARNLNKRTMATEKIAPSSSDISRPRTQTASRDDGTNEQRTCGWCGYSPTHPKRDCPANDKMCSQCKKKGHFKAVCRQKPTKAVRQVNVGYEQCDSLYLGSVSSTLTDRKTSRKDFEVEVEMCDRPIRFFIDSGADITVIPAKLYDPRRMPKLQRPSRELIAHGGSKLEVEGQFTTKLRYKALTTTEEVYVISTNESPLLGREAALELALIQCIKNVTKQDYCKRYSHMFQGLGLVKGPPYTIKLKTDKHPKPLKAPRRIPYPLRDKVKDELDRMESMGVIRRVNEPTERCAGMVLTVKPGGELRICVDDVDLNEALVSDRTILPTVEECLGRLAGATVFTKLDAKNLFWQAALSEESQLLTTFITPWGRYCFQRLPFGIKCAPEYFHATMKRILENKPAEPLQDDIIIGGKDQEEHDRKLEIVMSALHDNGVKLNRNKCELAKQELKFLGHIVSANGVRPDPKKVEAIEQYSMPTNKQELLRYLGM